MTISTMANVVTYAGNGVTTQFDWTFPIPSGALEVYRTENNVAVLVDPSAYSASGLGDPNGGTVSFAQAPALGQMITIKRNVGLTQDVALVTGSAFYAEVVEGAFDHATMQIQQLAEEMGRAVQVPIGSGLDPADYLDAAARSAATASAAASSAADSAGVAAAAQSGSETARNEAVAAVAAVDEAMAGFGPATTTVAGISRQATIAEATSGASTTPDALPHVTPEGVAATRWNARAIGEPFGIWGHLPGAEIPPTDPNGPRFIKLDAGDSYNEGLLSNETVTGNVPALQATAVIALEASPLYGQTIHLLNTERRFLRAGWSGEAQGDAIRNITGGLAGLSNANGPAAGALYYGAMYSGNGQNSQGNWWLHFDASRVVPTADENRPNNIGATYYMRIF